MYNFPTRRNVATKDSLLRKDALTNNERFYKGRQCKKHPDALRYAHSGSCVICQSERAKLRRKEASPKRKQNDPNAKRVGTWQAI